MPACRDLLIALLCCALPAAAADQALAPFGTGASLPTKPYKAAEGGAQPVDCLSPARAALWVVENPPAAATAPVFAIEPEGTGVLRIAAGACDPGKTTVRALLPGDGPANGDVWAKSRASYLSFRCRSNAPVSLTCHLLKRGKTAGTFQSAFSVGAGDWQRVLLPLTDFDLKSFAGIAGLGFRVASSESGIEPGAEVRITGVSVGSLPFTDDLFKSRRLEIGLNGDWRFATDPGEQGLQEKWFADALDDSAWKTIKSGQSWQQQGVVHHGFGWYRQKIFVPKECAGIPLQLSLAPIPSDDDAWFNGTRIGGLSGEYKYGNYITRSYTVPPSAIRYGADNVIALRIWGGDITFIGATSGLVKGPLVAVLDPYAVKLRDPGGEAVAAELYDLSDAQRGKPFEMVFAFPAELAKDPGAQLAYRIADPLGNEILAGRTPLAAGAAGGPLQAVAAFGKDAAQAVYLRGRLSIGLTVEDAAGTPLYLGNRELDKLSFAKRDALRLPELPAKTEDTPYGKLALIDEIDCTTAIADEAHPYIQGNFDHAYDRMTPGGPVDVKVRDILGKPARESGLGWYAYRIGRGKLVPHTTYLLRIEYPEDKPRFAPIEIQTGQNFMDVGWKNGVAADDVYDNWPLSGTWQWYDVIVPLDDTTVGTGGTGTASAENGFWVYAMNKIKDDRVYSMWSGGPAMARMKLYAIDPEKDAPVIRRPQGLPNRVLSFDWERQPDHEPLDLVRYAKLMGYSAISPVIIKWAQANYSEPLNGYMSVNTDAQGYWAKDVYDPASGKQAEAPVPGKPSIHVRYLDATKQEGISYIPRFEWGGSQDLPKEAWAVDVNGEPMKPNRFATWSGNLLNPLTWDDLQKLMDHLIKPYVQANPQLTGALWRIRSDRMPISYGAADLALFATETGTPLPPGGRAQAAAWAAGEMRAKYDAWWHGKRAQFHAKLAELLRSYRPDMELYYYNWDADKFGLIQPDLTSWAFVAKVLKSGPEGGRAAYVKERADRAKLTAADYISVLHTGNFGESSKGINRADYGIRPELYKDIPGIQLFAPANYLCYADKPDYLNYFQVKDGLAVSNVVSYDEQGARSINPKYEGNMITPGGPAFSMALELLSYFHGDARTLNYAVYTYGRGFADAHRRFAQAFLALPAIPGTVVDQGDADVKVRTYAAAGAIYVGVAYKGYAAKQLTVTVPARAGATITDLVTGAPVAGMASAQGATFTISSGPVALHAFVIK